MSKKETHWTDKQGNSIAISSMEDSYLINLNHFLLRKVERYRRNEIVRYWNKSLESCACLSADMSDGAYDAVSSDMHAAERMMAIMQGATSEEVLKTAVPCWKKLQRELRKRKLEA